MLFSIENIGFGRSINGVGTGGLSVSLLGRFGVADGRLSGVGDLDISAVATGDGEAMMPGAGVGAGYRLAVSSEGPRVMNHAIRTPEAPNTRTMANTQGKALLRESIPLPSAPRF